MDHWLGYSGTYVCVRWYPLLVYRCRKVDSKNVMAYTYVISENRCTSVSHLA